MKKLITILGSLTVCTSTINIVTSCSVNPESNSKKNLTSIKGADLTVSPTGNDERSVKESVLSLLEDLFKFNIIENVDVSFSNFKKATSDNDGLIVVTALETSEKLVGEVTLTIKYKS